MQALQELLFERNNLVQELEGQLVDLNDDIRAFEAMVMRVEVLTSAMSKQQHQALAGGSAAASPAATSAAGSAVAGPAANPGRV